MYLQEEIKIDGEKTYIGVYVSIFKRHEEDLIVFKFTNLEVNMGKFEVPEFDDGLDHYESNYYLKFINRFFKTQSDHMKFDPDKLHEMWVFYESATGGHYMLICPPRIIDDIFFIDEKLMSEEHFEIMTENT